jgi:sulfate adenylyltransferase
VPTPQHCPTARELADLELLAGGALAPVTAFNQPGSPITLDLPADLVGQEVELVDPEGLPLARLSPDGTVEQLTHAQHGPFRRLHLTPTQVREQHAGATFVPVVDGLTEAEIHRLGALGTPVVLLALTGPGTPELSPVALLRASLAAAARLPKASVVAVPLASHGDAATDHDLGVRVVEAYADGDPVLALPDSGSAHSGDYPDDIAAIVDADRPDPARQGLVLFFTGLSGSGKSTVARAVIDSLLERGQRTVTSLDGDVVRRNLSAGLTFSRADRETNIRRIGWVGAEISRHGGVAVCSPIAPFDATRQDVRAMTGATARACTPRPGAARSPSSPGSRPPTRSPRTPTCASTRPAAPSRTAATRCSTPSPGPATSHPPSRTRPTTSRTSRSACCSCVRRTSAARRTSSSAPASCSVPTPGWR